MLAALKPHLLAETALEVVALQEKEFKFYEGHISMLQTFSTLLAGFAFTTFVSVSEPLTVNMLLFKAPTGDYTVSPGDEATTVQTATTIQTTLEHFNAVEAYTFATHWIEVLAIILCLGENLYVLQVSLVATIMGNRLALRGPAGSLNRAIELMARALKRAIDRFVLGLQWFMLSIVFHALKVLHPLSSVMVCIVVFKLWRRTHRHIRAIAAAFRLDSEHVVIAAFPSEQQSSSSTRASFKPASRKRRTSNPLFALTGAWREVTEVDQKVEAAIRRRPESAAEHLVAMHQEQTTSAAACAPASAVTFEMDVELGEGHGPDRRPGALPPALVRSNTSLGPFDFIVRTLRGL